MDWLDKIFGPSTDSQGQLETARKRARTYTPQQEEMARRNGFKSADAMILAQRRRREGGNVERSRAGHTVNEARNAFKRGDAMAWHPGVILDKIAEMLKGDD